MSRRRRSTRRRVAKRPKQQRKGSFGNAPLVLAVAAVGCAGWFGFVGIEQSREAIEAHESATDASSPSSSGFRHAEVPIGNSDDSSRGEPAGRAIGLSSASSRDYQTAAPKFQRCGSRRYTCVVDGDTFWMDGNKIRIADIDTPEISRPTCQYEKALGERATERLTELLNMGPFELRSVGDRDRDQYGRLLRVVVREGHSLGDVLVSEGLARTWTGRREPWC